jgi:hypothetical protein
MLAQSLALVSISVLASNKRRIQARHENIVKSIAKLIRKKVYYNRVNVERNLRGKGEIFPAPQARNGSRDSKWRSSLVLYFPSWGNICGHV